MSHHGTFRSKFTEVFNRGFRRGANERAALRLRPAPDLKPPLRVPEPSAALNGRENDAWEMGFKMGFRVGASDAELARVDVPGAHGMISGFGEEILEQFGFFTAQE